MGISRRYIAKGFIGLSTFFVITPFSILYKFLSVPGPTIKINRTKIANRSDIPVGESLKFYFPTKDRPAILIHLESGTYKHGDYRISSIEKTLDSNEFVAYDGVCTHLGCPSNWKSSEKVLPCPCHGADFSVIDGTVLVGPPTRAMPKIKLDLDENGDIYATGYESGLPLYGMESTNFEEVSI